MQIWIWLTAGLACGPMHQSNPAGPSPPPPPPLGTSGAPAASAADPASKATNEATNEPANNAVIEAATEAAPAPASAPAPAPGTAPAPAIEDPYAGVASAEPANARRAPARGDTAAWLEAHNGFRAKHCAASLTWSDKLAQVAQRWANALRDKGCSFGHSGGQTGENLAAGTSGTLDPASVVKMWYDEIADYRFPDGGFSMKTGHFTQVVWRGTTQVGCGRSQCKGMDIFVCEYSPAGNWEGQYRDNVKPRGCR